MTTPTVERRPMRIVRSAIVWELADAWTIAKRNLRAIPRNPDLLLDVTLQPIVLVLLFGGVFGGALEASVGGRYVSYLMAGIFVQTAMFGAMSTAAGLAEDLRNGLMDRFRSLPMGRSSVMMGRAFSDLIRSVIAIAVMVVVGLAMGFEPAGSPIGWALGLVLLLAFTFAASWIGVVVALLLWRNPVAVQSVLFVVVFPLTFVSSAFVPVSTLPQWLQPFAANQPVSQMVDVLRALILGQPTGDGPIRLVAWTLAMTTIGVPVALRLHGRLSAQ